MNDIIILGDEILITPEQAGNQIGLNDIGTMALVNDGQLKSTLIDGSTRIAVRDLLDWFAALHSNREAVA